MLNSLFTWFYCLPMGNAVLLVAGCSLVYLLFARLIRNFWIRYPIHALFLTAWAALVIYMTVLIRRCDPGNAVDLIPFYSYYVALSGGNREMFRSNLMNVLLFVPGGLLCGCLMPRNLKKWVSLSIVIAVFAVFSAGIEWMQLRNMLGDCQTDDVIHNAFGAVIGAMSIHIPLKFKKEIRQE